MNPGGKRGGKALAPAGSRIRAKANRASGTMSTVPYKGMTQSDIQGVKEALAIRYGKPDPAVDAVRRRQGAEKPLKGVTKEEGRHLFGVGTDSAFKAVTTLKGTRPFGSTGTFVPDKLMTSARRRRLGIKPFSTRADSPTMYVERQPGGGWVINQRSGR